jgi:hypothetical protein
VTAGLLLALTFSARAHVGSPDTFFAGNAGPYAVRVTVRPPGVVPGRAEIFVRAEGPGVRAVTVRPMRSDTGPRGAPRADRTTPVPGQPGLYAGSLWLMTEGAYAIEVSVDGVRGSGSTLVPVESIPTRRLPMSTGLVILVAGFAIVLLGGGLAIVFAAAAESTLPPGETAGPDRRRRAGIATAVGGVVLLLLLWGERAWSESVARRAGEKIFRPLEARAAAAAGPSGRILRLTIVDPRWGTPETRPLVPDHGKLVHLFAVKEPAFDAFAHLHPAAVSDRAFESALPPLPEGEYSIFADVTDETGLSQTLTARARVPPAPRGPSVTTSFTDPDDSWRISRPLPPVADAPASSDLGGGWKMDWTAPDPGSPIVSGREVDLGFAVKGAKGAGGPPAPLEPYMGMLAHAAVLRADGSVFVHLHPMGSISMASLELARRSSPPPDPPHPMTGMAGMDHEAGEAGEGGGVSFVSFPYAFPKPGPYRLWVQVKIAAIVRTGVFDVLVR